tara:strand:+ start:176 stop:427 length:252 start_codon:yes stop_codon:yes gene_type:complete
MEELKDIAINLVSDVISFVIGSLFACLFLKKDKGSSPSGFKKNLLSVENRVFSAFVDLVLIEAYSIGLSQNLSQNSAEEKKAY